MGRKNDIHYYDQNIRFQLKLKQRKYPRDWFLETMRADIKKREKEEKRINEMWHRFMST